MLRSVRHCGIYLRAVSKTINHINRYVHFKNQTFTTRAISTRGQHVLHFVQDVFIANEFPKLHAKLEKPSNLYLRVYDVINLTYWIYLAKQWQINHLKPINLHCHYQHSWHATATYSATLTDPSNTVIIFFSAKTQNSANSVCRMNSPGRALVLTRIPSGNWDRSFSTPHGNWVGPGSSSGSGGTATTPENRLHSDWSEAIDKYFKWIAQDNW